MYPVFVARRLREEGIKIGDGTLQFSRHPIW